MKDETMIKLKRTIGRHPVLTGIATGGIIGGVWAAGYFMGRSDMHKDIAANTDKIIHKAYDIALDASYKAIKQQKPEIIDALDDVLIIVPEAKINYCTGVLKLKE